MNATITRIKKKIEMKDMDLQLLLMKILFCVKLVMAKLLYINVNI